MSPLEDHPLRYTLANELHARPFPSMPAPASVVFLAIKRSDDAARRDRAGDRAHLLALLDRYGAAHPSPDATHHFCQIGRHMLKWEQHTEFVTYTAIAQGAPARAFDPAGFDVFPQVWLAEAPGQRITSIMLQVLPRPDEVGIAALLQDWFVPDSLTVSRVLEDDAVIAGDFRIDPNGHQRFVVFASDGTGENRLGRIVQRLCEIETYKSVSMLGFSRARELGPVLGALDARLRALMEDMTGNTVAAETTLQALLSISAELESTLARASFRFGATGAYEALVNQRIEALRETRFGGRQLFGEFMMRRYEPAMRTVKSTERQLQALADRAMRAGDLLRTRVDVERSAQNQALLESMDRRADLQLRLQHTVEGLSVVAISYYAVSLAGYLLYPLSGLTGLSKGNLTALATLPVVAFVWMMIRRIRRHLG
ncbi:MAG: DUF3422 domain-containing protein [Marinibacterium sp.]|nr:DUF3422 domain-containing protein [Marinibacterium sp.]